MARPVLFNSAASDTNQTAARTRSSPARGDGLDYYNGVLLSAVSLGERASSRAVYEETRTILDRLTPDDYLDYVRDFVSRGYERGGQNWRYADVTTALYAVSEAVQPEAYLEIGVRRGRSMAVVGSLAPECSMIGVDMWIEEYAGMPNPGQEVVREQLERVGHSGPVEFLTGNSHKLLPKLFRDRRALGFDVITVDGDHTPRGAQKDIHAALSRLRIGGVLVFDDVRHPAHPRLGGVWRRAVADNPRYTTWEFDDVGYGVALAVRRW